MKGLLLEIDAKRRGVLLMRNGDVVKCRLPGDMMLSVGDEMEVSGMKLDFSAHFRKRALATALVLLLLIGPWSYAQTTSSVYIDVNPSIRLDVNFLNRIINYEALNADGSVVLNQVTQLKNKSLKTGVAELMQALKSEGYIQQASANRLYISMTQLLKVPFIDMKAALKGTLDEEVSQDDGLSYVIQEFSENDQDLWSSLNLSPLRYDVEGRGKLQVLDEVFSDDNFEKAFHSILGENEGLEKQFNDFDDAFDADDGPSEDQSDSPSEPSEEMQLEDRNDNEAGEDTERDELEKESSDSAEEAPQEHIEKESDHRDTDVKTIDSSEHPTEESDDEHEDED